MAPQETEEELLAGAAGLSLGTDGEVSGSARGAVLRALFLPAPVFPFFVRGANRGGGVPLSRRWTRDERRKATMVDFSEVSKGKETGGIRGPVGALLLDHLFNFDVAQNIELYFQ